MRKFAAKLTNEQMDWCRRFERAGFCSVSQAVKLYERGEYERRERGKIREYQRLLSAPVPGARLYE